MKSLIWIILISLVSGCSWEPHAKPSFLIIAVENLNSDSFICGDPDQEFSEGFGVLCEDGVRFTHAYTPSTMSQASLAALMTGLYPQESGVWHNGQQYLTEKFHTVAELALTKGYRTSFYSGGAPIWRKSGLAQGFEQFDDNISVSKNTFYRPVAKNFELFLNGLNESEAGQPFFSVVYLNDLQFLDKVTVNDSGQERAVGYDGQLKEINESFANLVQKIKAHKLWDNTNVILTGLNGRTPTNRLGEVSTVNMHSENTQVLLMIKPAKKSRDAGINWSIDVNVTLADLGATLYDLLGSPEEYVSYNKQLDVSSLRSALVKPQVDWSRERYIFSSSAWASWRGVGGIRSAVRKNNMLYINDQKPEYINTLTDRFEMQPLSNKDLAAKSAMQELKEFIQKEGISTWEGISETLVEKMLLAAELSRQQGSSDSTKVRLSHLVQQRAWDKQVLGWLARLAIEEKNWPLLDRLGEEHIYPVWSYVAKRNLSLSAQPPEESCWSWLNKKTKSSRNSSSCTDDEIITFSEWTSETDGGKKSSLEDRFLRIYAVNETDENIARANFQNGLAWDTALDIPAEPRLIQLALTLSEYKGYKQIVDKRIKRF